MNKIDEIFKDKYAQLDEQDFEVFNNLCDKAKKLIYIYNKNIDNSCCCFDYYCLSPEILTLSPIEQILEIAFYLYDFYVLNGFVGFFEERKLQKTLNIDNKKYVADFYFDFIVKDNECYKLKTPLIIECDGFDYHSNKKQMNYDYERETNLKLNGYDIIRFTGTQIYNKPFECVEKIYNYLANKEIGD